MTAQMVSREAGLGVDDQLQAAASASSGAGLGPSLLTVIPAALEMGLPFSPSPPSLLEML